MAMRCWKPLLFRKLSHRQTEQFNVIIINYIKVLLEGVIPRENNLKPSEDHAVICYTTCANCYSVRAQLLALVRSCHIATHFVVISYLICCCSWSCFWWGRPLQKPKVFRRFKLDRD